MRTSFSKRLIASGLVAAIGVNLVATSPAVAGPDRDKNFGRQGSDRDSGRGKGNDRGRDNGRDGGRDGGRRDWSDNRNNGGDRGGNRGDHRKPAVRVVQKPVVVQREVVRYKPAVKVVNKPVVVHREVRRAPAVRVDYRPQRVHYGPPVRHVVVVPERRRYRNVWVVRNYGHRYHGYGHHRHDNDAYPWLAFTALSVALIAVLSESQQRTYEDAQIRAASAPIGENIVWNNAGAYGSVTPVREGTSSAGRYCREFQQTVTIGGRTEQAYGTACMQPDGAWEVVS
jgi:hypothetical protein